MQPFYLSEKSLSYSVQMPLRSFSQGTNHGIAYRFQLVDLILKIQLDNQSHYLILPRKSYKIFTWEPGN
jgi:hypothetical protein